MSRFSLRPVFGLLAMALTVLGFSGFAATTFTFPRKVESAPTLPPALMLTDDKSQAPMGPSTLLETGCFIAADNPMPGARCLTTADEFTVTIDPSLQGGKMVRIWTVRDHLKVTRSAIRDTLDKSIKVVWTAYDSSMAEQIYIVTENSQGGLLRVVTDRGQEIEGRFNLVAGTVKAGYILHVDPTGGVTVFPPAVAAYPSH